MEACEEAMIYLARYLGVVSEDAYQVYLGTVSNSLSYILVREPDYVPKTQLGIVENRDSPFLQSLHALSILQQMVAMISNFVNISSAKRCFG